MWYKNNRKETHVQLTDDIKPIYLGYENDHRKYYFYFIKEGVPRFLAYVSYFYWEKGPQTALVLVPVPEEIEEELGQFLSGNLSYEFTKVRKNSKRESVKKLYRLPQQVGGGSDSKRGDTGVDRSGNLGLQPTSISTGKTGKDVSDNQVVAVKRHRRTKAEMAMLREIKPASPELIKSQLDAGRIPKVKRHRRTKVEISRDNASFESQVIAKKRMKKSPVIAAMDVSTAKVAVASSEVINVKKKRKPNP